MIILDDFSTVKSESSSKGNQSKFYKDGYWVKLDSLNCSQGLAEDFVSNFERCIVNFNFVEYKSVKADYKGDIYNACISRTMYNVGVQFITLRSLFRQNNIPYNIFIRYSVIEDNIKNVVEVVYNITGLNILLYLRDLLFLDALIINEDRHYMNLGVCYFNNIFQIAPCFDNGSSLFCVNWAYNKRKNFDNNMKSASSVARPFSKFFEKQCNALVKLGVEPLRINKVMLMQLLDNYNNKLYDRDKIELVKRVLLNRLDYYSGRGIYIYV